MSDINHGLTECNLELPKLIELRLYNGVEMAPCALKRGDDEKAEYIERISESEIPNWVNDHEIFWSVYLRYDPDIPGNKGFGGADCVGDFPNEASAKAFAECVYELLKLYRAETDIYKLF